MKNYVRIWVSLLKIKGIYIKNYMHTTGYLDFGKDLLSRLYLTGVYIIYNKSYALNKVLLFGYFHFWGFLWPWKLTLNIGLTLIIQFCFLDDLLKLFFLNRCLSIFTAIDEKKEEQKSTYIWRMLLRKKTWKFINTVDSRWFENLKIWTPSNQTIS